MQPHNSNYSKGCKEVSNSDKFIVTLGNIGNIPKCWKVFQPLMEIYGNSLEIGANLNKQHHIESKLGF